MNKRRLSVCMLCLTGFMATSKDNKGDYWGLAFGSLWKPQWHIGAHFRRVYAFARFDRIALTRIMGIDNMNCISRRCHDRKKYQGRNQSVLLSQASGLPKTKTMEEVIAEAISVTVQGIPLCFSLDQTCWLWVNLLLCHEWLSLWLYRRLGLLDHVLGENASKEQHSAVKRFAFRFAAADSTIHSCQDLVATCL